MNGRLEHELKNKESIKVLLKDMPKCVNDFYYTIQASKESITCLTYIRHIKLFLEYTNKPINKIEDVDIGKYIESISYTTVSGNLEKSSFSYSKIVWSSLNQFFTYLYKKGTINRNPMDTVPRQNHNDVINRKFLSAEDLNKILNSAKNGTKLGGYSEKEWRERDYLILFLLMNTGMRRTALSEINVSDISFDDNIIKVIDKRNKVQEYIITREMKKYINEWLIKREKILDGHNTDALFISNRKERMDTKTVYRIVQKYSKDALGYEISPHKLRAAFVTIFYEASGNDIKATCEAVGHSSINTTSLYITGKNKSRANAQKYMSKILK